MGVFVQINEGNPNGKSQRYPIGYVICESGCWEWVGAKSGVGYGTVTVGGSHTKSAHRWMYEQVKGPIPDGMTLDHLCRKRDCVNPDHLEVVTMTENVLRGDGPTARNARKTHCARGHQYGAREPGTTQRHCTACRNLDRNKENV